MEPLPSRNGTNIKKKKKNRKTGHIPGRGNHETQSLGKPGPLGYQCNGMTLKTALQTHAEGDGSEAKGEEQGKREVDSQQGKGADAGEVRPLQSDWTRSSRPSVPRSSLSWTSSGDEGGQGIAVRPKWAWPMEGLQRLSTSILYAPAYGAHGHYRQAGCRPLFLEFRVPDREIIDPGCHR